MTEPQERKVGCFTRANAQKHKTELPLGEVLAWIRTSPRLKALCDELRALPTQDERDEFKRTKLPAITPSATFKGLRQERFVFRHTGCVALDYDHIEDVDGAKAKTAEVRGIKSNGEVGDTTTIAAFRSPSGDGLKVLVHVSPVPRGDTLRAMHQAALAHAVSVYDDALGLTTDQQGISGVNRLCFMSYDPDAFIAPHTWALQYPDTTSVAAQARDWIAKDALVLDVETTGLGDEDQVVEIAIVSAKGRKVFHSLIRPTVPISAEAASVHGLTADALADAPTFADVREKVESILDGRLVLEWADSNFDGRMMRQSGLTAEVKWGNLMHCFRRYRGVQQFERGTHGLKSALAFCGIERKGEAHRALSDAEAAAAVLRAIAKERG